MVQQAADSYEVLSLVRCDEDAYLQPHTSVLCMTRIKHAMNGNVLAICPANRGYVFNNPELFIEECVVSPNRLRVLVANNSNRGFKLKKGDVLGDAREIAEVKSISEEGNPSGTAPILVDSITNSPLDLSEVKVSKCQNNIKM